VFLRLIISLSSQALSLICSGLVDGTGLALAGKARIRNDLHVYYVLMGKLSPILIYHSPRPEFLSGYVLLADLHVPCDFSCLKLRETETETETKRDSVCLFAQEQMITEN